MLDNLRKVKDMGQVEMMGIKDLLLGREPIMTTLRKSLH